MCSVEKVHLINYEDKRLICFSFCARDLSYLPVTTSIAQTRIHNRVRVQVVDQGRAVGVLDNRPFLGQGPRGRSRGATSRAVPSLSVGRQLYHKYTTYDTRYVLTVCDSLQYVVITVRRAYSRIFGSFWPTRGLI